ncbi:hypothetical protein JMJ35_008180 [Cladonia borealis]|uniref:Uncharacterized protein n=1 Tax=Cladonia borealis TaxID=184061 RepID=A0AA39U7V0_9LECA|nr:hypothetical protein JMJ35_008180 [Cladonia borealis]
MCIQIIERYTVCRCLYYRHQVDACSSSGTQGHEINAREVLVGYECSRHSSSTLYRQPGARARRQAREEPSARPHRQAREEYQNYTPLTRNIPYDKHGRLVRVKARSKEKDSDNRSVLSSSSRRHRDSSTSSSRTALVGEIVPQPAIVRSDSGRVVGFDDSVRWADPGYPIYPIDTGRDVSNEVPSWRPPPIDDVPYPGVFDYSESEVQTPSTRTARPGEIGTSRTPSPREITCPHHLLQNVASCPRECGWNVEQTIERGDAATNISRRQLHHLLTDSLMIAFANLSRSVGSAAVTQSSDPCRSNNSHTITDTVQLDTLQSDTNPEPSTSGTPQLPTANSNNFNEAECPSTATCHTRKTKKRPSIPPCYLLIFLGLLTVIGSLLPGLWRASSRNDLSGGFTLAQYILGVGIFVVGSMVAIHSKTCECWKTHTPVDQVVGAGH